MAQKDLEAFASKGKLFVVLTLISGLIAGVFYSLYAFLLLTWHYIGIRVSEWVRKAKR